MPAFNWVTSSLATLISNDLLALLPNATTVLNDSCELVRLLNHASFKSKIGKRNNKIWVVTADVVALYPSINRAKCLLRDFLDRNDYSRTDFVIRAIEFILDNSYLTFEGQAYLMIGGYPMGLALSPSVATIYMYMLEHELVQQWMDMGALLLYKRFIDDTFMVVEGSESTARAIVDQLNALDPDVNFTCIVSPTSCCRLP